ncbi:MAG: ribosome biogenesis GTPase Der [Opitutales bacterium]
MSEPRIVALVGRPNVGKSRLFNRLAGRRISIVHDQPGITRDIVSADIKNDYTLMDTGGLGLVSKEEPANITEAVEIQVHVAVHAASVILFVVDGREGLTPLDEMVADHLRRAGKKVVVLVNKMDSPAQEDRASEFDRLGFSPCIHVSAEHGRGESEMHEAIAEILGPPPERVEPAQKRIRICFVGRPNVGKSSLANRLLKSERLIVTDIPGTTRDAVELDLDYQNPDGSTWHFRLVDTAGVRRRTKVSSPVEYFSTTRSEHAIESADVVFLVLDAKEGVTKQEQTLGGMVLEKGKALVILVNKWDLVHESFRDEPMEGYKDEREFREAFADAVRKELFFNPDSPVIFVSALEGYAMDRMLKSARRLDYILDKKLPTGRLNKVLGDLAAKRSPPAAAKGKRFRIYYGVQTGNRPFRFKLFCNEASSLPDTYRRYLEAGISKEFDLPGCPIRFELVGKPKRVRKK